MNKLASVQIDIDISKIKEMNFYPRYVVMPWDEHMKVYEIYSKLYGNSQSAEKVSKRGGFGINESFSFELGAITELEVWFSGDDSFPDKDNDWMKIKFKYEDGYLKYEVLEKVALEHNEWYEVSGTPCQFDITSGRFNVDGYDGKLFYTEFDVKDLKIKHLKNYKK